MAEGSSGAPGDVTSQREDINLRLARFPPQAVTCPQGVVSYRGRPARSPDATLVLLHGIGAGSASWIGQLEGLPAAWSVYAWDAPGYGDSCLLPEERPVSRRYAESLHGFLNALGLDRVHLVGASLGALMAASYARHYPQSVSSLVLVDAAAGYGSSDSDKQRSVHRERSNAMLERGPDGLVAPMIARVLSDNAGADAKHIVAWSVRRLRPLGYQRAAFMLSSGDLMKDLAFDTGPLNLIWGEEDKVTPLTDARTIVEAHPAARLFRIPEAGHVSYIEQPGRFNSALVRCVEQGETSQRG